MEERINHSRFKAVPWFPKEDTYVLVGGAGGIGSWVAFLLARAAFKPVLYDHDKVEAVNMAGQFFKQSNVGMSKVGAVHDSIQDFAGEDIMVVNARVTEKTPSNPYVIAGFDNMLARRVMFEKWLTNYGNNPNSNGLFIDGRLTGEQLKIFCIKAGDTENIKRYNEEELLDDSEIEETFCSLKQTTHSAFLIAGFIVGFFTNHYTNVIEGEVSREVPESYEYFIPMHLHS